MHQATRARCAVCRPPAARAANHIKPLLVRDGAEARVGRVLLLVGAVARADERAGEDRAEAERLALLAQPAELVGVYPAVDRRVLRRRLEVLTDRDDVDAV